MRSGWSSVELSKVLSRRTEKVQLLPDETYRLMGVRWKNLGPYERGVGTTETIKAKSMYRMRRGDFVFNRIDTDKGAFGIVGDEMDGSVASNEFPAYVCNPNLILSEYLWLHFQQPTVLDGLRAAGTEGRARWKEADFETHSLLLPPIAEQRRAVDLFRILDEAIECAELAASSVYEFTQGYVDSRITPPAGVEGVRLDTVCDINPRERVPVASTVPFISMPDVAAQYGGVVGSTDRSAAMGGSKFRSGDILVGRITPCLQNRKIARVPEWLGDGVIMGSTEFIVARASGLKMSPEYLELVLQSERFAAMSVPLMVGSTGRQRLDAKHLGEFTFLLPSAPEQVKLHGIVSALRHSIDAGKRYAVSLRTLRGELLTALLSGEHEIPATYDQLMGVAA